MRLEAVITCVNYSDFLEHTLQENLQHFDHVVVVTTPDDKATMSLCNRLSVDCIDTTVFYERGATFAKGRGIRLGFANLPQEPDSWLLHLDADIVLPHRFRNMLDQHARLDPSFIYGADRVNVFGHENWMKNKARLLSPQFSYRCLLNPPITGVSLGARLVHNELGYCPIGFFQLFHSGSKRLYPINHGSAEHSDVLFAAQWPRAKRALLPEVFVIHLDSEKANETKMGMNWKGRKSRPFGPEGKVSLSPDFSGGGNFEASRHPHHNPYNWPWPWWWTDKPPKK